MQPKTFIARYAPKVDLQISPQMTTRNSFVCWLVVCFAEIDALFGPAQAPAPILPSFHLCHYH